jgi:hypothetical protein
MKINEGMRAGDLKNLVLNVVSVDEFQSKIDENAVVIGFYVHEQTGADDLNRFIQRSVLDILDVDTSPAPDQTGYYMVFVEIMFDKEFVKNLIEIIKEITPLVGIEHWNVRIRGMEEPKSLSEEILAKVNPKVVKKVKVKEDYKMAEAAASFLAESDVSTVHQFANKVELTRSGRSSSYIVEAYGHFDDLLEEFSLDIVPINLGLNETISDRRLENMLGHGWAVTHAGNLIIAKQCDDARCVILSQQK